MQDDINTSIKEFSTLGALFTHPHKLYKTDIAGTETPMTKTP